MLDCLCVCVCVCVCVCLSVCLSVCICVCYYLSLETIRFCYPEKLSIDEREVNGQNYKDFEIKMFQLDKIVILTILFYFAILNS